MNGLLNPESAGAAHPGGPRARVPPPRSLARGADPHSEGAARRRAAQQTAASARLCWTRNRGAGRGRAQVAAARGDVAVRDGRDRDECDQRIRGRHDGPADEDVARRHGGIEVVHAAPTARLVALAGAQVPVQEPSATGLLPQVTLILHRFKIHALRTYLFILSLRCFRFILSLHYFHSNYSDISNSFFFCTHSFYPYSSI